MKSGRGGARKSAGRPRIGSQRVLRLTLPDEEWERIDKLVADGDVKTQSEYFRLVHLAQWSERQIEWRIGE